ncbi:MAG: PAS domain S-box protein [Methanoregula sp.]|jgi:PAS domain S-box-containing protein|uniref:PAS domain S-box protein n=1 Tax=Methanoregula sp. TaxID=2052170 RepID=UPI0026015E70|nr:PAS domain S-box protein [Methanoregula sp.]MCK9630863.1 PAS domain S-box protein [Methanoregula sp.]
MREHLSSIIRILSDHPEGRMMKDLAAELCLNRNAMAKYLGILFQQGKVDIHHIGKAKVFTISKRVPFPVLAELSSDYVVGINRNMNCVDANTPFYAWTGSTPEEILGRPIQNLAGPVFQRSLIGDMAKTGISSTCEPVRISCTQKNRDYIYEIRSIPVVFGDCTTGCAVLIKDITDRETVEEKITLLEERYRSLASAQSEFIVHSLKDGTILFANPAFADLAGVLPDQLTGKKYRSKIPEEDIPSVKEHFRSIIPDNPERIIEHRFITPSGEIRWIRWKNRGIFRQGKLIEYHSCGSDITELMMAQNQLQYYQENLETLIQKKTNEFIRINQVLLGEIQKRKQTERNLQRTQFCVNNSSDMILWADESGAVTSQNKSALITLGLHAGDIPCFMKQDAGGSLHQVPWHEIRESAKQNGCALFEAIMEGRSGKNLQVEVLANFLFFDDSESCCFFVRDITERKQSEEHLRLLEISVDNAYDEVFWLDMAGNILYVNDAACRTTGYSQKELCSMHISELVPDLGPEQLEDHFADARQSKRQFFRSRHRRKDGVIIDVEVGSVYVTRGEEEHKICFVRDITERTRMAQAIHESEEKYRCIFESFVDTYYEADADGILRVVSPSVYALTGWQSGELRGKSILDLYADPRDRTALLEKLGLYPVVSGFVATLKRRDGTPVVVSVNTRRRYGASGEPDGVLGSIRDITENVRARKAIRESEVKYRLALDAKRDALWELDVPHGVGMFSPHLNTILGYAPGELDDSFATWQSLLHPDDLGSVEQIFRDQIKGKMEAHMAEYRVRTKEGGWKWILSRGKVVERDAGGNAVRIVGINTDITERKLVEDRAGKKND